MPPDLIQFDLADTADPVFDPPIEGMLVALIGFAALAFGAVEAWAEMVVFALSFAMAIVLVLKLIRRPDAPLVWSRTYWPIALFVALVLFQILPMPPTLVRTISPQTYAVKMQLLNDLPAERLRWMTLSFYPEATLHDLKVLLAVIAVYVVVLNTIRRASQVRRILSGVAIIGGVIALIALAQDASGTTDIYWMVTNPSGRVARGGPFVNRSHFGQFMNLSIGAAIGVLLALVHQHFRRDDYSPDEMRTKLRAPAMRPIWGALVVSVLGFASVMFSLSRGAMLGAVVAGAIVTLAIVTRRGARGRGWLILALALCIAGVVLLDLRTIVDRLHIASGDWQGNRLDILRDLRSAWKSYPLFGTGLGSFSVIFPMLDRSTYTYFATHAENEYAQLLTETGGLGLALALAFVAMITRDAIRAIRGRMSPASSMALGLCFGWIAILLHSFTDFGQHIPAIACLTATTAALLINLRQLRERELDKVSSSFPERGSLSLRLVSLVAVSVVTAGVLYDQPSAWAAQRAEKVMKRIDVDLQRRNWDAENVEYKDILEAADIAATKRPRNVEYRYWLNFYRWKSIQRVRTEAGGAPLPPLQREYAQRIVDELHAACTLAPTYGNLRLLAGMIERFELDQVEAGRRDLERARMLGGPDPMAAFLLGEAQALDGHLEESLVNLRRAAELNPAMRVDVSDFYLRQLNRPDLALDVAGDDLPTLDALIAMLDRRKDDARSQSLSAQAKAKSFEILERDAAKENAPPDLIARYAAVIAERGEHERAVIEYRRALSRRYGEVDWRFALARSLEQLGRTAEALTEADRCLQRRPRMPEALAMTQRLRPKR